jgi:hypothetical protein
LVVIDGARPEGAGAAAQGRGVFVYQLHDDGGAFFAREGVLAVTVDAALRVGGIEQHGRNAGSDGFSAAGHGG